MMKHAAFVSVAAGVVAGALALTGCTSSNGSPTSSDTSPSSAASIGADPSAPTSSAGQSASGSPSNSAPSHGGTSTHPVTVPTGTSAPYPTPGRDPSIKPNQKDVLESLPGSSSPSCAAVGSHPDLRSGSLAAGNFVVARKKYRSVVGKTEVPEVGLYLIPQHAGNLHSATVTVDPLGSGVTKKVTTRSVQDGDASRYFSVQIPVTEPGTYRLTVVSGQDHGCFVVTFAK